MRYINLDNVIIDTFKKCDSRVNPSLLISIMIRSAVNPIIDVQYEALKLTPRQTVLLVPRLDNNDDGIKTYTITYRHLIREHDVSGYSCDLIIPLYKYEYSRCATGLYIYEDDVLQPDNIRDILKHYIGFMTNIHHDYLTDDMTINGFKHVYTSDICKLFNITEEKLNINRKTTIGDLIKTLSKERT